MQRRSFISSAIGGAAAGALTAKLGPTSIAEAAHIQPSAATRALTALRSARRTEVGRDAARLRTGYHSDALRLDPASVTPLIGRAAVSAALAPPAADKELLYFYYRQPQVVVHGNAALVVSNYESGQNVGGRTVEDSGKTTSIVLLGPNPPLIAAEAVVPNIYAGSYGALGTALARPRFGKFPLRALGQPPVRAATTAGGGENDIVFNLVRRINAAWVQAQPNEILGMADPSGVFLIGDYSPYYISGSDAIREHFADFYRTGSVTSIREINPQVKLWGNVAAVTFDFDLDYTVNNQQRRAPGHAMYTFARTGTRWAMSSCSATHLVNANIGDPYTLPG